MDKKPPGTRGPKPHAKELHGAPMLIPDFPVDVRYQAKSKAAVLGIPFREFVIHAITEKIAKTK
jgi:hypothetical protein